MKTLIIFIGNRFPNKVLLSKMYKGKLQRGKLKSKF